MVGPKARLDDGTPAQVGGGSDGELEDQRSDEELEVGSKVKLEDAAVDASRGLGSKAEPENAAAEEVEGRLTGTAYDG